MPVLSSVPGRDGASRSSTATVEPGADPRQVDAAQRPNAAVATSEPRRPSRRRWLVVAAVVVVALGAGVAVLLASDGSTTTDAEPITLQAVTAETADLVEFTDLTGTLRYSTTSTVLAGGEGVVTAIVADGSTIVQGDELYAANGSPVVAFYGDVPLYRDLGEGAEGDDVLLLEQNLAVLGYNVAEVDDDGNPVDGGFVVDGVFDDATTDAVIRWQEDLGIEPTGLVTSNAAVVLGGPSEVTDVDVAVGDQLTPGAPILELKQVAAVTSGVFTQAGGEVESFVNEGQALASGDVVYAVDGDPVTAIVSDVTFDRDLTEGIDDGPDVAVVEEMLLALGYDAGGDLVVDETFDDATAAALSDWQADLENTFENVSVDGALDLDEIVVVEPGSTVGAIRPFETTVLASGTELWTNTIDTTERIVETAIPVADQDELAEGNTVDVEFPDGEIVAGTVTSLATSSTVDPANPDAAATLAVEITVPSVPASVEALNEIDVVVKLVDEIAEGVTTVPASALVAVGDGRYAVEVVTDLGTEFVAVTPGMFSNGLVEVDGISPGTQVVIPS